MDQIVINDLNLFELSIDVGSDIDREELLGEFLHLCLYYLKSYDGHDETVERAINAAIASAPGAMRYALEKDDKAMIYDLICSALKVPEIKGIFSKDIYSLREAEFITEQGSLLRIDRVNFYSDGSIEVIEYKLRKPNNPIFVTQHRSQVIQYMKVMDKIYGKRSKGRIVYFEDREVDFVDGR